MRDFFHRKMELFCSRKKGGHVSFKKTFSFRLFFEKMPKIRLEKKDSRLHILEVFKK